MASKPRAARDTELENYRHFFVLILLFSLVACYNKKSSKIKNKTDRKRLAASCDPSAKE